MAPLLPLSKSKVLISVCQFYTFLKASLEYVWWLWDRWINCQSLHTHPSQLYGGCEHVCVCVCVCVRGWKKQWVHLNSLISYFLTCRSSLELKVVVVRHIAQSEEGSLRSHERETQEQQSLTDRDAIGYQLFNCTLQLIRLIWYPTSLKCRTGVKRDNRSSSSVSLPWFIFYLFCDSPSG